MITSQTIQKYLSENFSNTLFKLDIKIIETLNTEKIKQLLISDYKRYYTTEFDFSKIKYFKGLLATFFYRISRELYLNHKENEALEYSSLGAFLTSIELYYSSEIGEAFKINHGTGTVVGARSKIGNHVLLHQNVTLGEKNGRPTLKDNVIVYPGAVIVGEITVGENSIIGANTFLDKSLPPHSIFTK
ncbi:MAG: serine acetyltransferase [Flavobacteriales bacterium]|nr:serine acetyltransferase [Flavobacteriales bacterium]